ncbi:hypothetical protein [Reyranella sp.]|uniref:hypothetical protein n=1 Tax=Reyranella sp. TaxID=1929291 RepID=UPI003D0C4988
MIGLPGLFVPLTMIAAPAMAQSLQGVWQFERQAHNGRHAGIVVIDGDDARSTARGPVQEYAQCGFVRIDVERVEIVFTKVAASRPYSPDRFICTASGGSSLVCYNRDAAGHREPTSFALRRTGDLPDTASGRLEDICRPREKPNS